MLSWPFALPSKYTRLYAWLVLDGKAIKRSQVMEAKQILELPATADLPLPPPDAMVVLSRLQSAGHDAVFVGGGVRDRLLGRTVDDWDLATSAEPEVVAALFEKVIPTGIAHGTVTVLVNGTCHEVTTYRLEGAYSDGRRPDDVVYTTDLTRDLSRRDFTINAMAWDPNQQQLYDPFDGRGDLSRRMVRAVGNPVIRLREDGLRALRAVRFACVLDFDLSPDLLAAIPKTLEIFAGVSMERVYSEMVKMSRSPRFSAGIRSLYEVGLLNVFFPERTASPDGLFAGLGALEMPPESLASRWALVCHDLGIGLRDVLRRLRFSNRQIKGITALVEHRHLKIESLMTREELFGLASMLGREHWEPYLEFRGALGSPTEDWRQIGELARDFKVLEGPLTIKELAINGRQLMDILGIKPSPLLGRLLDDVLHCVWRGETTNEVNDLILCAQALWDEGRNR